MRYLFYLGHPAHFHLFRNTIGTLKDRGHEVEILIKKKDILEDLMQRTGWPYRNILRRDRGDTRVQIAWSLLVRDWAMLKVARAFRPHLMLGTSAEITHVGRLLGIPSVVVNEDDADVVPLFARLAYPFASTILAPVSCRVGAWASKTVAYEGYHELAYLHPDHFAPDERVARKLAAPGEDFFILRFARLNAHHDAGRTGITEAIAARLIELLEPHGRVHITSERPLEPRFEPYRIGIDPMEIHSALYYASMYVGDSQTMAAEAAVLGTPALRFNDFVGEIGYLEELEHRYRLTRGIRTDDPDALFDQVRQWLAEPDLRAEGRRRAARMLEDKIDVAAFMTSFIERYGPNGAAPATRPPARPVPEAAA